MAAAGMLAAVLAGVVITSPARADDDPPFVMAHGGLFGFERPSTQTAEFGLAYRSDYKLWVLKPHFGVLGTANGAFYGYGGLLMDVFFGNRVALTLSTAAGGWHEGDLKPPRGHPLGYPLEFRSGVDLAYRFDDRSRLGMGVYHISNAGLGKDNPGENTVEASYALPLAKLLGQ